MLCLCFECYFVIKWLIRRAAIPPDAKIDANNPNIANF